MNQMIVVNFPLEIFSNDHFYIHYKNILNVFSRVIALILASLAIQFIVDGIKSSFGF